LITDTSAIPRLKLNIILFLLLSIDTKYYRVMLI